MNFASLNSQTQELIRPLIKRLSAAMESVISGDVPVAIRNCSVADNIEQISKYIQNLKSDGCKFDAIQNIEESDLFVYTNDSVYFDIDVYFNGKARNNGFFAVFAANIDSSGTHLAFETIKT